MNFRSFESFSRFRVQIDRPLPLTVFFQKIFLLCILLFLVTSGAHAENAPACADEGGQLEPIAYTLDEAIERGLAVNPRIQAAEAEIRKAEADIGRQRGDFFPSLSAQSSFQEINSIDSDGPSDEDYQDQEIWTVNFGLSQPLFYGMTIFNAYQKAVLGKERVEAWKQQVEMRLVLNIQELFFDLLKAKEDVESLSDAVHRLKINVEMAEAFHEKQMAPYAQVLQARVELADALQRLSQAKNKVETNRVQLNILLGYSGFRDIAYVGKLEQTPELAEPLNGCLDYAYENRPEIRVAKKGIEIARKDKKIALGQFSPRLSANANYYIRDNDYEELGSGMFTGPYDRDQKNTYWTVSLQLQWQFGLGGQQFYGVSKASHEIQRLEQDLLSSKDQISAEVRTYYMAVQEANERIETTQTAVAAAREGYAQANKRFEVRMGTIAELLDAQARLSRAEANYNQAIGDYLSSLARLNYAMGLVKYRLDRQTLAAS